MEAIDIFDWFGQADLVKMDIEGGEWAILMMTDSAWRCRRCSYWSITRRVALCPIVTARLVSG